MFNESEAAVLLTKDQQDVILRYISRFADSTIKVKDLGVETVNENLC